MRTELAQLATQAAEITQHYDEELQPFVSQFMLEALFISHFNKHDSDFKYQTYQHLMLALGSVKKADLTLPPGYHVMEAQQCYANAYDMVCADDSLTYVEGYAFHSVLPVAHAWVEDEEGRIIDPTWCGLEHSDDPPFAFYAGIKIDTEFLIRRSLETEWVSIFANDWARGAEILRLGFVMDGDIAIGMGEQ